MPTRAGTALPGPSSRAKILDAVRRGG